MRKTILAAACLMAMGCGVSQDIYQDEFVRARQMEARSEDLSVQLATETAKTEELAARIDEADRKIATLEGDLERARRSQQETSRRLDECWGTREEVGGDLEAMRKQLRAAQERGDGLATELEGSRAELATVRSQCDAQQNELFGKLENIRERVAVIAAERDLLLEEKHRLEREKQEKLNEVSRTYEGLLETMKEEIEKGRVTISELRGQLSVGLQDEILFASGSATVKAEGREVLNALAQALAGIPDKALLIEGHTDDVPIRGVLAETYPSNWELSTARAVSVVRYLVETGGMDPARVGAAGYGEHRPVADNSTEEGRARNRRIEIKLVPVEPPAAEALGGDDTAGATDASPEAEPAPEEAAASDDTAQAAPEEAAADAPVEQDADADATAAQ